MRRHVRALFAIAALGSLFAFTGSAAAAECPNEAIRVQQQATFLPDCRAFEQVSPADKGVYTIQTGSSSGIAMGADGNSFSYLGTGGFPGARSSLWGTGYLATRGGQGWTSTSTSVAALNPGTVVFSDVQVVAEDGSRSLVGSNRALVPGAVEGNYNLYLEDNVTGELSLIFGLPTRPSLWEMGSSMMGGTPDFSHVLLVATEALTPDAIDNGNPKLYEFTDGQMRLVSYVPVEGGETVTPAIVNGRWSIDLSNAISRDGSRIFFSVSSDTGSPGDLGLYMRVDGEHTVALSKSQRSGAGEAIGTAAFRAASADGSIVYFTSTQQLTDQSPPFVGNGYRLYRLDIASGVLTDSGALDPNLEVAENDELQLSRDGQQAFFSSGGRSTPGPIFYWKGEDLEQVPGSLGPLMVPTYSSSNSLLRSSPSGRYLAFLSQSSPTGYNNLNPAKCSLPDGEIPTVTCQQVYVYDAATRQVNCASCQIDGERSQGHAFFGAGFEPLNAVTDSGTVFFTSPDRLSPEDSNGLRDTYQYSDGRHSLISGGAGSLNAQFLGATADGSDVFFTTAQRLVAQDRDNVTDVYDARVNGGLAGQNSEEGSPSCTGEGCRTAPDPPGTAPPSSSLVHGGAGAPSRRCAKSKKAAKRKRATARRNGKSARNSAKKRAAKCRVAR